MRMEMFVIECDECGERSGSFDANDSTEEARAELGEKGWTSVEQDAGDFGGSYIEDFCPDCSEPKEEA